jgi:hypothetical protein
MVKKMNHKSFESLKEGDTDPVLGKMIEVLIENGNNFIVYLDQQLKVRHSVSTSYEKFPESYGEVLNRIALLDGLTGRSFMSRKEMLEYRCMTGTAIARMYENASEEIIFEMLESAEEFLNCRITETARILYFASATAAVLCLLACYILISLSESFCSGTAYEFISGIMTGAAGAYLSLIMNSKKRNVNPASGCTIHFFESVTRLLIGMIGSFFISLLVYAGFLNPGINNDVFMNILIFSFIAGFSERMVPNIIHHFEGGNGNGKK